MSLSALSGRFPTLIRTLRVQTNTARGTRSALPGRHARPSRTLAVMTRGAAVMLVAATVAIGGCSTPTSATARPSSRPGITVGAPVVKSYRPAPIPTVFAHRGGKAEKPEASMVAFRSAAAEGAGLELDVQALADGTLVVMHDATVDRTTNGTGKVSGFTSKSWSRLRIPSAGTPPTWTQIADEFAGTPMLVEVKTAAVQRPLVEDIVRRGLQHSVIVQSFVPENLTQAEAAGIPTMLLVASGSPKVPDGTDWLGCSYNNRATCLAAAGSARVAVWGVNSVTTAQTAKRDDVAMVITDRPTVLTAARR